MENATDALKIAFAALIFVMALTIAITMFSQLNRVSQIVLASSDITNFYSYDEVGYGQRYRIVGLETIIPTLYKYYKENYTVLFLDQKGAPLPLYESQTDREEWGSGIDPTIGTIGRYYTEDENQYERYDYYPVCTFDLEEETTRWEPWTASNEDAKKNLDAFLGGGIFVYPKVVGNEVGTDEYEYDYGDGFIKECSQKGYKFKEFVGEYDYNISDQFDDDEYDSNELLTGNKKRVIVYQVTQ